MKIKKAKSTKKWIIKTELKFQDYEKDCLKFARIERKANYLEKKIKINVDCAKVHQKDFVIKNCFEGTIKISGESLKVYQKEFVKKIILKKTKYLKVKSIMFILNQLTRLL